MPEYRNATASLKENTAYVNEILPVQESFDIVQRNRRYILLYRWIYER